MNTTFVLCLFIPVLLLVRSYIGKGFYHDGTKYSMFKSLSKLEAALSEMLYEVIFLHEAGILSSILPAEQGAMLHRNRGTARCAGMQSATPAQDKNTPLVVKMCSYLVCIY